MGALINVFIAILGSAGALLAFFGETIRKDQKGIRNRLTNLGWISIFLMSLTLLLGIYKEIRSSIIQDESSKKSIEKEVILLKQLDDANISLNTTKEKLSIANSNINLLNARVTNIPRELFYPYISTEHPYQKEEIIKYNGKPVTIVGGDKIQYYNAPPNGGIYLRVGDTTYEAVGQIGEFRVTGHPINELPLFLVNPNRLNVSMKVVVTSTR